MGANQSSGETRSVTMDNPTPAGVIDVSDEVVQRLKLGIGKARENTSSTNVTPPAAAAASKQQQTTNAETRAVPVKPKQPTTTPASQQSSTVKKGYQVPTPLPVNPPAAAAAAIGPGNAPPILSAMEMRRQKEIELQQNDQMWRNRMSQLEQTLNKTNSIMEKEYTVAMEDVRKRFTNASATHQLPPCQDLKSQLIACYRANPGETLKCAAEVAQFRNCVSMHRVKKLDDAVATAKGA